MFIGKKIIQKKINKKYNTSYEDLVKYFERYPVHYAIRTGMDEGEEYTANATPEELAKDCMKLTEGVDEDILDIEYDPLETPSSNDGSLYSNLMRMGETFGQEHYEQVMKGEI